jgi:hypothetical protein
VQWPGDRHAILLLVPSMWRPRGTGAVAPTIAVYDDCQLQHECIHALCGTHIACLNGMQLANSLNGRVPPANQAICLQLAALHSTLARHTFTPWAAGAWSAAAVVQAALEIASDLDAPPQRPEAV